MFRRFTGAAALAFAAATVFGQTALADTEVGQTGNHVFTDSSTHPGATCNFRKDASNPNKFWLRSFTVVAPSIWWPDTNSSDTTQHGPVGWRFAVQVSTNMGSTFRTVGHSSYQRSTAYEDQGSPYDPSKAAPLTNMTLSFNTKAYGGDAVFRIVERAIWFKPTGRVLGYVKHPVQYYNIYWNGTTLASANPFCGGLIQIV